MNLADIRAELEEELSWRLEEMRFFKNQLGVFGTDLQRDRFRRALVVMLYSHFEGFWRAAFSIYVQAVNSEKVLCRDAIDCLVAASLFDILAALADNSRKHDFFRRRVPDDAKLHQFHRQVEFLARLPDVHSRHVEIPADKVVDPESNLTPVVIRKNLFRLGFDYRLFEAHEGTVMQLLNRRNAVAHGSTRQGITGAEYDGLELAVIDIMKDVIKLIFDTLKSKAYLKPAGWMPN